MGLVCLDAPRNDESCEIIPHDCLTPFYDLQTIVEGEIRFP